MKWLDPIAFILVVLGALNWGLVALLKFNLVSTLLGAGTQLENWAYILVGVAAVYVAATHPELWGMKKK
jgi:uncharacterized protein